MRRVNTMKTKQFNKKLSLNKKTVANLNNGDMNAVQGGQSLVKDTCSLDTGGGFTCDITRCASVCPTCNTIALGCTIDC